VTLVDGLIGVEVKPALAALRSRGFFTEGRRSGVDYKTVGVGSTLNNIAGTPGFSTFSPGNRAALSADLATTTASCETVAPGRLSRAVLPGDNLPMALTIDGANPY
jgi:hypothetical protein